MSIQKESCNCFSSPLTLCRNVETSAFELKLFKLRTFQEKRQIIVHDQCLHVIDLAGCTMLLDTHA